MSGPGNGGGPFANDADHVLDESKAGLIRIGLRDPFIQGIAGVVTIATAVSIAINTLGDGKNTIIAVALALIFGVILIVFRVLILNIDNTVVRWLCIFSSVTLTGVFLIFVILALPAVTFCWPPLYAEFLGVRGCKAQLADSANNLEMLDLHDQNGTYVGIYPSKLFGYNEKVNDVMIYSWSKQDKRTLMTVESFPNDPARTILKDQFEVLRNTKSKVHTYCLLREKMFVVAYIAFDNRIHYAIGRNKNEMITVIRTEYSNNLKWDFDKFLTDLVQYFIVDLNKSKLLQAMC